MQEMLARFLGKEGPLEKEMATHSNILPWEIPWTDRLVYGVEKEFHTT